MEGREIQELYVLNKSMFFHKSSGVVEECVECMDEELYYFLIILIVSISSQCKTNKKIF